MTKFIPPGGSRKGIPNKLGADVKAMIEGALTRAGGENYLLQCAKDPSTKKAFLALVGRILPMQITGENGGPIALTTVERVITDPGAPKAITSDA